MALTTSPRYESAESLGPSGVCAPASIARGIAADKIDSWILLLSWLMLTVDNDLLGRAAPVTH